MNLFGVDAKFWHPDPAVARDIVLSIGNDGRRDFRDAGGSCRADSGAGAYHHEAAFARDAAAQCDSPRGIVARRGTLG
ncbi:MAG: hypothetical protein WDN28_28275 [Chthoniobacter sp.]